MNGYILSRQWFSFAYENPKVKPVHTALYFWILERCNASGWKKIIDIQTEKSMDCLGITDWRTYKNALQFLEDTGFILWIEKSKNQFTCNRISINENPCEVTESYKFYFAQNAEANAEAIAEVIAEAYAEADVEAIAEALQSYINLKTNKPLNLKTFKQEEKASDEATPTTEEILEAAQTVTESDTGPDEKTMREEASQTEGAAAAKIEVLIFPFDTPNFRNAWQLWIDHRARKKIPYKNLESEQMALKRLSQFDEQFSIDLIEESIERGWEGLIFKQKTKDEYEKYLKAKNHAGTNTTNGNRLDVEEAVAFARMLAE